DPFNIYDMLNKNNNKTNQPSEELQYPPGFTPSINKGGKYSEAILEEDYNQKEPVCKDHNVPRSEDINSAQSNNKFSSQKTSKGGSLLEVLDEMDGCMKNIEAIIGSQGDHDVFK
ncbi:hypothetical protein Tco_1473249, partial [Tanacetum coccineum]